MSAPGSLAQWTTSPPGDWPGDARGLAEELRRELAGEVGFAAKDRALYATDASNYRQVPIGVVRPRTVDDVVAAVAICRRWEAPILGRGAGTSLAGQCANVAVVLDFTRHLHRVLAIDPERRLARVEPGCVLDDLRAAANAHGLTFGPDPATHRHCTIGGMLGNNSCGVHSVLAGRTVDNVHALDVLTYDGARFRAGATDAAERAAIAARGGRQAEIYSGLAAIAERTSAEVRERFPDIPRRVAGYNLDELLPERGFHVARSLVGSEGTLAVTLEAELELVPWPAARVVVLAAFADVFAAADAVPAILATGPIGLEGMDDRLIEAQRKNGLHPEVLAALPPGGGWLLVEYGAETAEEAAAVAERALSSLAGTPGMGEARLLTDPAEQARAWRAREAALAALARVPGQPDAWEGWEDSAVPPARLGGYLRDLRALYDAYGYDGALYGHFGDGCVHSRTTFDLTTPAGVASFRAFMVEAAELVVSYGGSISGEHGDGQARAELLPLMFGDELCRAFGEVKALWDPAGRMNPGKLVAPYPLDANLRHLEAAHPAGAETPAALPTAFAYRDDRGSFPRAVERCVGVGLCRSLEGGTMCPSYRATGEEEHSTRGRARLLFEMLRGETIADGWQSDAVAEALDLCLACKACKSECPAKVDMATYKAEFLYQRYRRRLRPRAAYAFGLVYWHARLASRLPRLANAVARGRWTGTLLERLAGVAPERALPAFAGETFRAWHAGRPVAAPGGPAAGAPASRGRVLLWPDTFTNFFQPEVGRAAVEVLEAAGFEVALPPRILCCGRPLYDHGMLDLARRQLVQIVAALRTEIRAGVPLVGLEPSCVATFRDELPGLLPDDPDARRLSAGAFTLAELLARHAADWVPTGLAGRRAVVHRHCHHQAVMGFAVDRALLGERLGLAVEVLDSGCCGMAGGFGYERGKVGVSMACAERVLLPAVRAAEPETLVVADGFSCRSQIEQATGRRALHLAEVLRLAMG